MEAKTTSSSLTFSPHDVRYPDINWDNVFPQFDFNNDTFVGEFNNFGTARMPIAICLGNLFHPVKPYIFSCNVKFRNPDILDNPDVEYIYPDDYNLIGLQTHGRLYIPRDCAHKILGDWWVSTVWPKIKDIPGITKVKGFYRFNNIEMEKYIPGWTTNWKFYSGDVCERMKFE